MHFSSKCWHSIVKNVLSITHLCMMFLVRRGRARVVYYQQQQLLGMNTDSIKHPKNERCYNYSLEEHE